MVYLRVQLKVCEGCGGLWFRTQGGTNIYCSSCEGKHRTLRPDGGSIFSSRIKDETVHRIVQRALDQYTDMGGE